MNYQEVIGNYGEMLKKADRVIRAVIKPAPFIFNYDFLCNAEIISDKRMQVKAFEYYNYEGYSSSTYIFPIKWLDYSDEQLERVSHWRDIIRKVYFKRCAEIRQARYNKKNQKWLDMERAKNKAKWERIEKAVKAGKEAY